MTDEQILKRMAEIEGWYVEEILGHVRLWVDENFCKSGDTYGIVDPLTNWSDLGPLIEKYKIGVDWLPSDLNAWDEERGLKWEAEIWDYSDPEKYKWVCSAQDKSLPHAICLAIIEANGG